MGKRIFGLTFDLDRFLDRDRLRLEGLPFDFSTIWTVPFPFVMWTATAWPRLFCVSFEDMVGLWVLQRRRRKVLLYYSIKIFSYLYKDWVSAHLLFFALRKLDVLALEIPVVYINHELETHLLGPVVNPTQDSSAWFIKCALHTAPGNLYKKPLNPVSQSTDHKFPTFSQDHLH